MFSSNLEESLVFLNFSKGLSFFPEDSFIRFKIEFYVPSKMSSEIERKVTTTAEKTFNGLSNLISIADNIHFTKALCIHCRDGTPAIFSKRKSKSNERILSGAAELYEPVCRVHFCM